ncbi:hypothetical protein [Amycolatopsis taiwanensis]|uniref:Uncharacterized protein n=1 Tax=Amycolatopsis taiwanensis TaxID=342230 RepID=A0A9W6VEZ6_9PSEU|nr:hypothetical protein [Amycolatopsis taiwanensis]GLY64972.1 hypothetical protein Atai01_15910 [Amycolatopsis taiwanensis]
MRGANYKGTKPSNLDKIMTYTLVRTESDWKVTAFQNTKRKPLMEAISFKFQPASKPAMVYPPAAKESTMSALVAAATGRLFGKAFPQTLAGARTRGRAG